MGAWRRHPGDDVHAPELRLPAAQAASSGSRVGARFDPWLRFHVFVGIMSPLVILFHTAFQWGNQLATPTYVSVLVVVATGLVGRWHLRLGARRSARRVRVARGLATGWRSSPAGSAGMEAVRRGERPAVRARAGARRANGPTLPRSLPGWILYHAGRGDARPTGRLRHARRLFLERSEYRRFCAQVRELRRLRAKLHFHRRFKRLMSAWRGLHVVLGHPAARPHRRARLGQPARRLPVALVVIKSVAGVLASRWLLTVAPRPSRAQFFSPGPLARPHARSRASRSATSATRSSQGLSAQLCLDCHTELAGRVAKGAGFHGQLPAAKRDAVPGLPPRPPGPFDFAMIDWEGPRDKFDHQQDGLAARGRPRQGQVRRLPPTPADR